MRSDGERGIERGSARLLLHNLAGEIIAMTTKTKRDGERVDERRKEENHEHNKDCVEQALPSNNRNVAEEMIVVVVVF